MGKIEDYRQSLEISIDQFNLLNLKDVSLKAGADFSEKENCISFLYCGEKVKINQSPFEIKYERKSKEIPLTEKVLILHYLVNADGSKPGKELITFREVPSGEFYWSAFVNRAKKPLTHFFSGNKGLLLKVISEIRGVKIDDLPGDVVVKIQSFPQISFFLQVWYGDEEFNSDSNILMTSNISKYLSTEDIALAASLPIYKMIGIAKEKKWM